MHIGLDQKTFCCISGALNVACCALIILTHSMLSDALFVLLMKNFVESLYRA